jgi:hypothetical protein
MRICIILLAISLIGGCHRKDAQSPCIERDSTGRRINIHISGAQVIFLKGNIYIGAVDKKSFYRVRELSRPARVALDKENALAKSKNLGAYQSFGDIVGVVTARSLSEDREIYVNAMTLSDPVDFSDANFTKLLQVQRRQR